MWQSQILGYLEYATFAFPHSNLSHSQTWLLTLKTPYSYQILITKNNTKNYVKPMGLVMKLTWEKLGTLDVLRILGCPWACRSSFTATLCRKRSNVKILSTALTPLVYFSTKKLLLGVIRVEDWRAYRCRFHFRHWVLHFHQKQQFVPKIHGLLTLHWLLGYLTPIHTSHLLIEELFAGEFFFFGVFELTGLG